tara:strand:+ start:39 stop:260 length:222 start_codon:yes stop_codon:yes gene_type:complete
MADISKIIKTLEQIIDVQNNTADIMQERIDILHQRLAIASINNKPKSKYPIWLWNAIYFLAGIGFWQTLLWLL